MLVLVFVAIVHLGHFIQPYTTPRLTDNFLKIAVTTPGSSPVQTVIIPPLGPTLAVWTMVLKWNKVLEFWGFPYLGSAQGTQLGTGSSTYATATNSIGTYRIVQPSGNVRLTADIVTTSTTSAFIDLNGSGAHESQWEPKLEYNTQTGEMKLSFPPNGGGDPGWIGYDIPDYGVFELNPGIFSFPTEGRYTATWTFTSVDPDNGGANNGIGDAPLIKTFTTHIDVAKNNVTKSSTLAPLNLLLKEQKTK